VPERREPRDIDDDHLFRASFRATLWKSLTARLRNWMKGHRWQDVLEERDGGRVDDQ
jgi:hypothetical protein